MSGWSAKDIPEQDGRVAVVTGANSGIGYVTARELARRGARVVLACRSEARGTEAGDRLTTEVPGAEVEFAPLDLADLGSVREFAEAFRHDRLDLLINNAGVMALPYGTTADGFETQFGVNHLGHFALTGLLLPTLLDTAGARVVNVSSMAHSMANIDLDDLNSTRNYRRWTAYGRSKTANLLFTHELARRLAAQGSDVIAAAVQPGFVATDLHTAGPRMAGNRVSERLMRINARYFGRSVESGALPTLYAATAPGVRPDSYTGPALSRSRGTRGASRRASWTLDDRTGELLWAASEELTGVTYDLVKA